MQSQVDLTLLLGSENGFQEDLRVSEAAGEEADALMGRQIRRLTAVIVKHVPNFWRLWLAIYSGRFAKVSCSVCLCGMWSSGGGVKARFCRGLDRVACEQA